MLTQYRNREMTQTEIQSAYIALLLGCKFVMDVCVTQVKVSAIESHISGFSCAALFDG